ncbi:MAG: FliG C-terminal domain-containing protein [Pacificimonas sp.]
MPDALDPAKLTSEQQAAVLLMLLDEEQSAAFVETLDPASAEALAAAMVDIAAVDQDTTDRVINQFLDLAASSASRRSGPVAAKLMFDRALGEARSATVMGTALKSTSPPMAPELQWIGRGRLADLLSKEDPHIVAAALSLVPAKVSAQVLAQFTEDLRFKVLAHMARLTELGDTAIALIREAYSTDLLPIGTTTPIARVGGLDLTVDVLKLLPGGDVQAFQQHLAEHDEDLAAKVDEQMFVFEDLLGVSARDMQQVIAAVQPDVLTTAMRGVDDALKAHVLSGMSTRASQTLEDDLKSAKPIARDEVDRARAAIMQSARTLADKGEIQLGAQNDLV